MAFRQIYRPGPVFPPAIAALYLRSLLRNVLNPCLREGKYNQFHRLPRKSSGMWQAILLPDSHDSTVKPYTFSYLRVAFVLMN